MIKIKNISDYNKEFQKNNIPNIINYTVLGQVLMNKEFTDEDYYSEDEVDLYGPLIVIMDYKEFMDIENLIPSIKKDEYEFKEIVGVDSNCYVNKYTYLFNNGESAIIVFVVHNFIKDKQKFRENMYITSHINESFPKALINLLVNMVEKTRLAMYDNLDYLQVFDIKNIGNKDISLLRIEHRQEEPNYCRVYYLENFKCEDCKLFWISEEDENGKEHSTLMFAEDY